MSKQNPAGQRSAHRARPPTFRHRLEYAVAWVILKLLGWMPLGCARLVCAGLARLSYACWPKLRKVGMANLRLAFPDWTDSQRRRIVRGEFQTLGRMLAEFAHFPRLDRSNLHKLIVYDGFEVFERARQQGRGVLFLTAHFGNWELGSFAHGIYGYPCNFVVREMDNPLLDALINRYRSASGGRPIEKKDFARGVLRAFERGESVGVLMDQNMLPEEGVFVDFFGLPASTTTGPARIARKLNVPIVLGLVIWDRALKKYRLHFDAVTWLERPDPEEAIVLNTAHFTHLIEQYVRRYPDQWLWVHRRWKTRPPGAPELYS